jgi:hypothetical protein
MRRVPVYLGHDNRCITVLRGHIPLCADAVQDEINRRRLCCIGIYHDANGMESANAQQKFIYI